MFGAAGIDLSMLKGKMLLNIDSEDEGIFTVSCAGGARATISVPFARKAVYGPAIRLVVDGLQSGHSGVEIHKNRANANKVMGEFLRRIQQKMPLCLVSYGGGTKDNVICYSCEAHAIALGNELESINAIAEELQAEIRANFNEPTASVQAYNADALGGNALSQEDTAKAISLICAVPNSVQKMSQQIEGLVQTSLNLGVARLDENLRLTFSVRSSVNQEKEDLLQQLRDIAAEYAGNYSQMGEYPAWEYKEDSKLRDTMVEVYRNMYGKEAEVVAIHAGLECGLLGEKIEGLDAVSIGPEMHDIHTSRERLGIASVGRTWEFVKEVLKAL
jgi:dipeptidase D